MTGEAHWFPPLMVVLGGLGVLLLGYVMSRAGQYLRRVRRHLDCPVRHHDVKCTLVQERTSGRFIDIERCSEFENPAAVTCKKTCLTTLRHAH